MPEAQELTALLVDDENSMVGFLQRMLNRHGITNIDTTQTTQEGLDLLADRSYDIVFTDLNQVPAV